MLYKKCLKCCQNKNGGKFFFLNFPKVVWQKINKNKNKKTGLKKYFWIFLIFILLVFQEVLNLTHINILLPNKVIK